MKRSILITLALAAVGLVFGGTAKADTITIGGVSYTMTYIETDSPNVYDVQLTINTSGAVMSGTLSSFAVQFTGATSVSLETAPSGWSVLGQGTNNPSGCNINGSANWWCSEGSAVSVPGGTSTFLFDVTMPAGVSLPTESGIQAFQGQGALAISNDVGIGTSVPEPSSLAMLGFGLIGLIGYGRRRLHI